MDVTDSRRHVGTTAGTGLVAGEAAGAERRETTLVREARERVGLVHELRELRGAEELLDGSVNRPDVDERVGRDVIGVLRDHALADDTLHATHANTELVLHELAHRTDTTVAKVVDVIDGLGRVAIVQREQVAKGAHDVLARKDALGRVDVKAKLLVYLITADLGKVIALAAEVHAVEERGGVVPRGRLTRALTTVDLQEGVVTIGRDVALDGRAYDLGVTQKV